jgi:hypothetical protein
MFITSTISIPISAISVLISAIPIAISTTFIIFTIFTIPKTSIIPTLSTC